MVPLSCPLRFCRNYLETTLFDLQELQFKLRTAAAPTCPEDKAVPADLLKRQRIEDSGRVASAALWLEHWVRWI